MPTLMIKVNEQTISALREREGRPVPEIVRVIEEFGATLGQATGDTGESALYLEVTDVSPGRLEDLRVALSKLPGVEAAYVKPDDALP
jgi:hypothetical protein